MALLDRLRRKWRHSDPEVRLAAVRQLGKDDQELLTAVARQDDDAQVRRLAIKKLEDPVVLLKVARDEPSEGLRSLAAERAADILVLVAASDREARICEDALGRLTDPRHLATVAQAACHETVRQAALSRISDERTLGKVARKAGDPSTRHEALRRVGDLAVLRSIAVSESPSELALAALEKIDDPDTLHAIAEDRVAQRSVRQRARERLDLVIDDDHPIRAHERRERQRQLCLEVEALGAPVDPEKAASQMRDATTEWEDLSARTEPHEDIRERFRQACQAVLDELARQERWQAAQARRKAEQEEKLSARLALCQTVESLDGAEARRGLEEARAAWDRLGALPESEDLTKRFREACKRCETRYESWQARDAFRAELEVLANEAEQLAQSSRVREATRHRTALEKRWAKLESSRETGSWTEAETALRQRFLSAGTELSDRVRESRERREQEKQENLARLQELCARVEKMATSETLSLRAADRELRAVTAAVNRPGPLPSSESERAWKTRLSEARRQLLRRAQEQRDSDEWKRWAATDVQETLVRRLEALLETDDLREVDRQLRQIQEEWKRFAATPGGQSEALWQRFRRARDELRRRCNAYFSENLKKKTALCEEVEGLAESTAWTATAEAIKRIQAEWKQIGPVPHRNAKALWQRFRAPCNQFFERRNQHFHSIRQEREENASRKTDLCGKAEELSESTDWDKAGAEIKQLQAEWKRIGPTAREDSDALWTRFRAACDHFFDRRKRRGELDFEKKLALAESICTDLESVAFSAQGNEPPLPEAVRQKVTESWTEWRRQFLILGERAEPFKQRLRDACERIAAACPDGLRDTPLDPETTRKKREKLCAQLEELVRTHLESAAESPLDDLAERLKYAIAAKTIGGSAVPQREQDWKAATEEVERLRASWDRIGPVIGESCRALAQRFEQAYASFSALPRAHTPHGDTRTTP